MKVAAIIVAAGSGTRAGGEKPKQYQSIGGKSMLRLSLEAFASHPRISHVVTVIGEGQNADYAEEAKDLGIEDAITGGASRQESCRLGVEACLVHSPDYVLIHDAARPFVSPAMIDRVIDALQNADAVIPALAMHDTIKLVQNSTVQHTLDRSAVYAAQTPQGFHFQKIRAAHAQAASTKISGLTDDASVAEAYGMKVHIVEGETINKKLTTMQDIKAANTQLNLGTAIERPDVRVGQGMDFHVFEPGQSLWLCGVEIPHTRKLKGHSDADVALHALTDAIFGAIGESDIGTHFPPSDPQWKDAKSSIFLAEACARVKALNGQIANVDITILAEVPRISPHLAAMKAELSRQLGLDAKRIAIKATTTEEMGAIGRKEGMAANAVVIVRLPR